jgi:hypothetical protein
MTTLQNWLRDPDAREIGESTEKLKLMREYVAIWLSGQDLPRIPTGLVGPDEESKSGCAVSPSLTRQ